MQSGMVEGALVMVTPLTARWAQPATSRKSRIAAALKAAADRIEIGAGFLVGRRRSRRRHYVGVRRGLRDAAHAAGIGHAVVHLRVGGDGDLVGQVRRADDDAGEAAERGAAGAVAGLHADLARKRVERLLVAHARDEARAAKMVPPLPRLVGRRGAVVLADDDAVAANTGGAGPAAGGRAAITHGHHAAGAGVVARDL